ncbi:MAG: DUF3052 domain-containing protein [Proteobacteria bacterium]|nr:DUF3052 domain-containing protein [Cystobacterineae bacterium]MCL2258711.1 DUF3052 domain-containing protein [Cystobacterineae bacterium]MCL2315001.1 DUF3052 domain-containing protein [Pseudomonadota bacterium]
MTKEEAWSLLAFWGIRTGMTLSLCHMPSEFREKFLPFLEGVHLMDECKTGVDIILFFGGSKRELVEYLPKLSQKMSVNGRIWVFFHGGGPEGEGLSEEFVRWVALHVGLADDRRCPEVLGWLGLRLKWRPRSKRLEKPSFCC